MQGTGYCGQNKIIDGGAVAVSQFVDWAHIHHDCAEAPMRSGRLVERARLGTLGHGRAEFVERGEEPAERLREPPQGADAAAPGVSCERTSRGACLWKGWGSWDGRTVEEPAENGQSSQSVPHNVVHDEDQRCPAAGQGRNKGGSPQGTVIGQRLGDEAGGKVKETGVVGLRLLFDHAQVIVHVEAAVIDPDRSSAAQRDLLQPLP